MIPDETGYISPWSIIVKNNQKWIIADHIVFAKQGGIFTIPITMQDGNIKLQVPVNSENKTNAIIGVSHTLIPIG